MRNDMIALSRPGGGNSRIKHAVDAAVALLLAAVFLLSSFLTGAQAGVGPNDMSAGSLLLKTKKGDHVEAPRLGQDYDVTVSGPTARTIVTQRFSNPSDGWVEGVYVFPLPEGAAVDTLKIVSGNRVIVGEVKEKQEAKIIYEKAKEAGQTASLVEQERPNLFTNSVANIGPYESVVVQIEYQETVKQTGGTYSLRLPLVVAPRYNPAPIMQTVDFDANGNGVIKTVDPVPDADRISPPVLDPRKNAPVNMTSITVKLNAGFAIDQVKSAYHQVKDQPTDEKSRVITLAGDVPADKDFELTWTAKGTAPQLGLFKERVNGKDYLLATVTPPSVQQERPALPRETIFVIDNSGSMDGPSMVQAKDALLLGLGKLKPEDRFNVIRFDDTMDQLFATAVPADQINITAAKNFVSALQATGGTEMIPPLKAALVDDLASAKTHLRQIVFITDGAIGNEQEMFTLLSSGRGRSRVFMVGIGSAPNSYLMTRAAELGRGTFTFIGEASQVTARMDDLFNKIGQPVLTGLEAKLSQKGVNLTPSMLPDLYQGEPVLLMTEADALSGDLTITGNIGDAPWQITVPVSAAAEGKGISKMWAHRKISDLEVALITGKIDSVTSGKEILNVALTHQIVSSQTSLIAVDKSPKRPAGERLTRADVPLNLPAGWNFDKVFGVEKPLELPKSKDERDARADFLQLASTDKPVTSGQAINQVQLPQTATPAALLMIISMLMMFAAAVLRWFAVRPRAITAH
jgi:Ca-activated chloride channel homolog